MRDETEWVELVHNGYNCLMGAQMDQIIKAENEFIPIPRNYNVMLYGNGNSGEKIVDLLLAGI